MHAEDRTPSRARDRMLTPQMALVPTSPEAVSVALVRYASNPSVTMPDDDQAAPSPLLKWVAEREDDAQQVTLTLQDGPLRSLVLRFAGQPDGNGATMLWITGDYVPRRSLLYGVLERWRAQRDARALRDGVVAAVTAMAEQAGPALRRSPRARARAHARLFIADHGWIGEVLDVSDGGLAVVIVCAPAQVEATATFLRQQVGEIELSLPGISERIPVVVRRTQPGRGGLEVGLQVLEPQSMLPLIRKALARR